MALWELESWLKESRYNVKQSRKEEEGIDSISFNYNLKLIENVLINIYWTVTSKYISFPAISHV